MPIKLYNALTRRKETFEPYRGEIVSFYTCGPTVYDYVHIGNLRTFIMEDFLRRALELNLQNVKQIMNITDIDDKTIRGSRDAGKSLKEFTSFYEEAFRSDLKKLNIAPPSKFTRATENIREMVKMIEALLEKKIAYKTGDGVYFDISKFKNYGKLSRLKKQKLKAGARVSQDEYRKEDAQDFALWKFKKEGEPSWPASFGEGRPGWHIECSAMSIKYLGMPIDIHAGGIDLIFPHHENEIAQSEAVYRKKFVRFFIEGEMINVGGRKMSKSLKNIFTLREIIEKGFDPLDFRYLTLTAHYRSPLSFTWESLAGARNARMNLEEKTREASKESKKDSEKFKKKFLSAINDDLNIPKALALAWKARGKDSILFADKIFGLGLNKIKKAEATGKIKKLLKQREAMRQAKKWSQADEIRKKIKNLGFLVEDTASGPKLKRTLPAGKAG